MSIFFTYFSKLIIVTVFSIITFGLIFLIVLGGCKIAGVNEIVSKKAIAKMIFVQLLLNISLTSFIMMIYYLTRKAVIAMISGRLVSGLVQFFCMGLDTTRFSLSTFWAGTFVNTVPGIIIQLIIIPVIVMSLEKYKKTKTQNRL